MESEKLKEYVMYIVVNTSLKMGKGKIAAQVAHSVCRVVRFLEAFHPFYYLRWLEGAEATIVLKATEDQMKDILGAYKLHSRKDIKKAWCMHTIDAGRTQISPGSLTTLAFRPMMRIEAPTILQSLKLL